MTGGNGRRPPWPSECPENWSGSAERRACAPNCRSLLRSPRHARTFCIHGYCANVADETANQRRWRLDADTLHEVGAHIVSSGVPTVEIRLPAELARRAAQAWQRDDEQDDSLARESRAQAAIRDKAATLALIGLAITESGRHDGAEVVVRLSADLVGGAVAAADDS
jgi:hypothetical protein